MPIKGKQAVDFLEIILYDAIQIASTFLHVRFFVVVFFFNIKVDERALSKFSSRGS